jgi:hypothetical protein
MTTAPREIIPEVQLVAEEEVEAVVEVVEVEVVEVANRAPDHVNHPFPALVTRLSRLLAIQAIRHLDPVPTPIVTERLVSIARFNFGI